MEKTTPFFSILIPAYNVSDYIGKCINSIRMQINGNWEAIIVDDGSTDGTGEICKDFSEKDERIKLIQQSNQGVAVARNVLLTQAKGDYIIFLDGDDFWYSNEMLSEVSKAIVEHNSDMIAWWLKSFDNDTGKTREQTNCIVEANKVQTGEEFLLEMLSEGSNCCWWSFLYAFKRELWENSKVSFNPGRKICEDEEVLFRVFLQAKRVWVLGRYYYAYRVNRRESATGELKLPELVDMLEVAEKNIRYLENRNFLKENVKRALIKNFSGTLIAAGMCMSGLSRDERIECYGQLTDKKWMLENLQGYGSAKFRVKVIIVKICGIKVGFFLLGLIRRLC